MPNVVDGRARRFRDAYPAWWEAEANAQAIAEMVTNAHNGRAALAMMGL